MILKGQIEFMRDIGKQCIAYLVRLSKLMAERILGEIALGQNLSRATKERNL